MARLRYVLMMERDLPRAIEFLQKGIGARVRVATTKWAELDAGDTTIALKEQSVASRGEQETTSAHQSHKSGECTSPMLVFDVDNLQHRLTTMLQMGAEMDGAVQYTLEGSQVAVLKSPSGHLIGMVESSS